MKSPATISAFKSMKQRPRQTREQMQRHPKRQPSTAPERVVANHSINGRRVAVGIAGLVLTFMAIWLLATSFSAQWQVGMLMGVSWIRVDRFGSEKRSQNALKTVGRLDCW